MINALGDKYRLTRSYAAKALGKFNNEQAVPHLVKLLEDEFFGARAEASESIGKICAGSTSLTCETAKEGLLKLKEKNKDPSTSEMKRVLREANIASEKILLTVKKEEENLQETIKDLKRLISLCEEKNDNESKKIFQNLLKRIEQNMIGLSAVIGMIETVKFGMTG